jgi:CspA family cold shock protein
MKRTFVILSIFTGIIALSSCSGKTDVVDSGTYQGNIKEVEAEKTEIYVTTDDDKTLELYFTDETTLTRKGEDVAFSELSKGQKVEVEVEKEGKRLTPISVEILD